MNSDDSSTTLVQVTGRPLTERQGAILEFIRECIEARGFPPTLREIGERFHISSTNGVNDHLRALERKGAIYRDSLISRGIRIADGSRTVKRASPTEVVIRRADLEAALSSLESIADWIPRPVADRYEGAIDDIKTALARAPAAPARDPEAA